MSLELLVSFVSMIVPFKTYHIGPVSFHKCARAIAFVAIYVTQAQFSSTTGVHSLGPHSVPWHLAMDVKQEMCAEPAPCGDTVAGVPIASACSAHPLARLAAKGGLAGSMARNPVGSGVASSEPSISAPRSARSPVKLGLEEPCGTPIEAGRSAHLAGSEL